MEPQDQVTVLDNLDLNSTQGLDGGGGSGRRGGGRGGDCGCGARRQQHQGRPQAWYLPQVLLPPPSHLVTLSPYHLVTLNIY